MNTSLIIEETKITSKKKKKRGTNLNYWRKIGKKKQSHILRSYFHFLFRRLVIDKVGLYFWLNWFWTCADVRITEYADIGKSRISDSLVLQVLSRKTWVECTLIFLRILDKLNALDSRSSTAVQVFFFFFFFFKFDILFFFYLFN